MNNKINNYLILNYSKVLLNAILIAFCLGLILNLFEEVEFFKNSGESLFLPIILTLSYIPNLIFINLMPFIIFISSMWFFISISSNKELLTLKTFGVSNVKIVSMLSIVAFLFGIFVLLTINPLTSLMVKSYEKIKADYSKYVDHLVSINQNGVWIKELEKDGLRIVNAKNLNINFLEDVSIYMLDEKNKIKQRIEAKRVDITDNEWIIYNSTVYNLTDEQFVANKVETLSIKSLYTAAKINSLYKNLDTISFLDLVLDYDEFKLKGYPEKYLEERINSFISMPFFLFLMVFLSSIFTIKSSEKKQNIYYIFIAILSVVIIYFLKDASVALGQAERVSLVQAVWIPIIAIFLFCSVGILQINDK